MKQRRMNIFLKYVCLACLLFMGVFCALSMYVQADSTSGKTVRVLLPLSEEEDGLLQIEEDGTYSGYYVDYLNEIAKYTDWNYEFTIVSDAGTGMELVESGKFDLMIGMAHESSREAFFEYSKMSFGSHNLVVATSKDNSSLLSGTMNNLEGLTIGVCASDVNNGQKLEKRFESYCFSNGISYSKVEHASENVAQGVQLISIADNEIWEKLDQNKIDAVLTSDSVALAKDLYVIDTFSKIPIYFVSPKGNSFYINQIDNAIYRIRNLDEGYEERLYSKFFSSNEEIELAFTNYEQTFLTSKHVYTVAIWDGCAPYTYKNQDGEWAGVVVEVFKQITDLTMGSLNFEFVGYDNYLSAVEAVKAQKVDILGCVFATQVAMRNLTNQSSTYFTDQLLIWRNRSYSGSLSEARVVVREDVEDSMLEKMGVTDIASVKRVSSAEDTLLLVNNGEADITLALNNVASYYINYHQMSNVTDMDINLDSTLLCYVNSDSVEPIMISISNKCIRFIDQDSLQEYAQEIILYDHKEWSIVDYIKKNSGIVTSCVICALVICIILATSVIITIYKKSEKIYRMLYFDDVTDDISYLHFEEIVDKMLQERGDDKYFVIYADISGFKYINDVFGYQMGNSVLNTVKELMKKLTGGQPVARVYADRFVGVCQYEDKELLEKRFTVLLREFETECAEKYPEFNIFMKIGICEYLDKDKKVKFIVDLANYAADSLHRIPRSEIVFYSKEMHDEIMTRKVIEKDMHRAMKDDEFIAFYQPKYDIETNQIIGAEALVRWMHKDKGMMPPGLFISIFEQNRFIIEVDKCIFERVCKLQADRIAQGKKLYPISCNFSRLHFQNKAFPDELMEIVRKYNVPTNYIEIEITETIATNEFDDLSDTVIRLKEKGFRISIDDFGSGYSCIQLLYKLPIDALKFDRVFVLEMDENATEEEIHKSIVDICHSHDIKVICEGVETIEQKDYVRSYGCRYVQGYLYSRPVAEAEFLNMLESQG